MPTLVCNAEHLFSALGRTYTEAEFDVLCFQFGIELDEVRHEAPASGNKSRGGDGLGAVATASSSASASAARSGDSAAATQTLYYIALPANRTDLLCIEGLTRALNVFLGRIPAPVYTAVTPARRIRMLVKPNTKTVRPYVVGAVLRGVTFTQERYDSFIDLQDKLHANIARKRTLVAIGTHDLDAITLADAHTHTHTYDIVYDAQPPGDIVFTPLAQTRDFRADELMEFYRTSPTAKHLRPYVDILSASPMYPILRDAAGVVLSLPPIINGNHTRIIAGKTRNIFIECTATDLSKAHVVLNTVVAMFSQYTHTPFEAEEVEVRYEDVASLPRGIDASGVCVTPQLHTREVTVDMARLQSTVGVPIPADEAAAFASRMQLTARVGADAASGAQYLHVTVPPTRADVLHEVDVIEDVAIAYGYNNIPRSLPKTVCTAAQQPVNKLTDQLRHEFANAGYTETLTFALVSAEENFSCMNIEDDGKTAVVIANPQTQDFQQVRVRMIPGLLKSLASNKSGAIAAGIKLFEISDVALLDASSDVGARNARHAAALYCGPTAGFEVIHGLVDRLFQLLEIPHRPFAWEPPTAHPVFGRGGLRYFVEADTESKTYMPGRGARVMLERESGPPTCIGTLGVLHPTVLRNFELTYPVSVMEVDIEAFV